ncbi:MAG: orotidine-5'-phosphate decarboxylase [Bdellovibrionaceae bacterium]|nr:orotidine-5'-phosphate decarboxylase [Pseudobdellovibrionaceae bacterium]|tara:strand:+ start:14063 stop:14752 length:690 start_codon:yes stop_codon:yes gene_type:complete
MENPIFLALDVDTRERALELADQCGEFVGGFKIGPRLNLKYGHALTEELSQIRPVFVDNKFYDIPNTMAASVQAVFDAGASFCTIHAQAGPEALSRLAELEKELCQNRPFKILAVTVLTSFNSDTLPSTQIKASIPEQVELLAKDVLESGLKGLVCSGEEARRVRELSDELVIVTPGIRPKGSDSNDQKRVLTPKEALEQGSSYLVVGRPILAADSPRQAAKAIFDSLS